MPIEIPTPTVSPVVGSMGTRNGLGNALRQHGGRFFRQPWRMTTANSSSRRRTRVSPRRILCCRRHATSHTTPHRRPCGRAVVDGPARRIGDGIGEGLPLRHGVAISTRKARSNWVRLPMPVGSVMARRASCQARLRDSITATIQGSRHPASLPCSTSSHFVWLRRCHQHCSPTHNRPHPPRASWPGSEPVASRQAWFASVRRLTQVFDHQTFARVRHQMSSQPVVPV